MSTIRRLALSALLLATTPSLVHAGWRSETADALGNSGQFASLAIGADGTPFIGYRRAHEGATRAFFGTKVNGLWLSEAIDPTQSIAGNNTSIQLTDTGRPAIAYIASGLKLRLRALDASATWIPLGGGNGNVDSLDELDTGWCSLVWEGTLAAPFAKLTANSAGAIGDLYFGAFTGAQPPTVSAFIDTAGNVGASNSLAKAPDGTLGVAFLNETSSVVRYGVSTNNGANWTFENIPGTSGAIRCQLVFDAASKAHVIFRDGGMSRYRYATNASGAWVVETIGAPALNTVGFTGCSIAVAADGTVHAAYLDYATNQLAHAIRRTDGVWTSQPVDAAGQNGADCAIALTPAGQPRIAYHDITNQDLKLATFTPDVPVVDPGVPVAAPGVTIAGKKRISTTKAKLLIRGRATGDVTRVAYSVGKKKGTAAGRTSWRFTARLQAGRNIVRVTAVGPGGTSRPAQITIVRR